MVTTVQETVPVPVAGVANPRLAQLALFWPRLGLGLILLLSAALELVGLADEGYANSYYAAGIKSMLTSWHNFFFVSYDAGGFVTIDKPPLGLWIEAASAKLLGFSGFSMLLPEALSGVLSVALLYQLIARSWGPVAGLTAALALAVTPISVVIDRNNTMDSPLILVLLLGAWAATLAAEQGRLRMLLLCALFVGLGFNIKMLQAFLVLPAFGLMYLLGAPLPKLKRVAHLVLATVVLLVVSLAWATFVDLTPASQRPFVSDSGTNSELSLALGYNGLGRFTQVLFPGISVLHIFGINIDLTIVPTFAADIGNPGFFRMLSPVLGTQVSWLLPLALIGLLVAVCRQPGRLPLNRQGQSLMLWGGWLLVTGFFFSTARFYHIYYLVMFAPAVAALAGIAVPTLWSLYARRSDSRRNLAGLTAWILPGALLATAAVQISFLNGYPDWSAWLTPLVVGVCALAAMVLVAGRLRVAVELTPGRMLSVTRPIALAVTAVGLMILLAAPTTWAAISLANGNASAWLPSAGPSTVPGGRAGGQGFGGGRPNASFFGGGAQAGGQGSTAPSRQGSGGTGGPANGGPANGGAGFGGAGRPGIGGGGFGGRGGAAITFAGSTLPALDSKLLQYLEANQGKNTFLVATMTSSYASLFILDTKQPAMALGGYQGWDRIVTPNQLSQMVSNGTVRFFYISSAGSGQAFAGGGPGFGGQNNGAGGGPVSTTQAAKLANTNNDLSAWVSASCSAVPTSKWQTAAAGTTTTTGRGGAGGLQLYDCASAVKH